MGVLSASRMRDWYSTVGRFLRLSPWRRVATVLPLVLTGVFLLGGIGQSTSECGVRSAEWGTIADALFLRRRLFKIEVGTPVAGRPPHRSRRAVCPHRALPDISLTHLTGNGCSAETAHPALRPRQLPLIPVESAQPLAPRSRGEVSGSGAGAAHTHGPCNSSSDCADSAI